MDSPASKGGQVTRGVIRRPLLRGCRLWRPRRATARLTCRLPMRPAARSDEALQLV